MLCCFTNKYKCGSAACARARARPQIGAPAVPAPYTDAAERPPIPSPKTRTHRNIIIGICFLCVGVCWGPARGTNNRKIRMRIMACRKHTRVPITHARAPFQ